MESAPTNGGEARSNRETAVTAAMANPCRGRFNIGPVCGGTGVRGRGMPSPANRGERPTKRDAPDHPGNRRAGCPHPAGPAAARTSAGGINPAPTNRGKRPAARETAAVGRDACIPAGRVGVFWRFCENPGRWFEFSASYGIIAGKRLLYDFCAAARRSGWRRPGNRLLARNSTIPLRGMV